MKTRTKRILLLSLCLALLAGCAVFAFAAPKYGDTKVVGHVVYSYRPGGKYAKAHYAVTDFFDTDEAAKENTKKTIKIRSSIGGVPVTAIETGGEDIDAARIYSSHRVSRPVRKIVLPDTITSISPYAFAYFPLLKTVNFPDGITDIPDYAFYECRYFKKVEISNLKSIGDYAFYNCCCMYSFTFPDTLESIGDYAFYRNALKKASFPCKRLETGYAPFKGSLYLKDVTFRNGGKNDTLVIGDGMFAEFTLLNSVTLPAKAKGVQIGGGAFKDCTNLKTIKNPELITEIQSDAFANCFWLESFTIPAGIRYVHPWAFIGCRQLKTLALNSTDPLLLKNSAKHYKDQYIQDANFIFFLRNDCKIYVLTPEMQKMAEDEGLSKSVILRAPDAMPAAA